MKVVITKFKMYADGSAGFDRETVELPDSMFKNISLNMESLRGEDKISYIEKNKELYEYMDKNGICWVHNINMNLIADWKE